MSAGGSAGPATAGPFGSFDTRKWLPRLAPQLASGAPAFASRLATSAPAFTSRLATLAPRLTPLHPGSLGLSIRDQRWGRRDQRPQCSRQS
jgi:hypothetical protein